MSRPSGICSRTDCRCAHPDAQWTLSIHSTPHSRRTRRPLLESFAAQTRRRSVRMIHVACRVGVSAELHSPACGRVAVSAAERDCIRWPHLLSGRSQCQPRSRARSITSVLMANSFVRPHCVASRRSCQPPELPAVRARHADALPAAETATFPEGGASRVSKQSDSLADIGFDDWASCFLVGKANAVPTGVLGRVECSVG